MLNGDTMILLNPKKKFNKHRLNSSLPTVNRIQFNKMFKSLQKSDVSILFQCMLVSYVIYRDCNRFQFQITLNAVVHLTSITLKIISICFLRLKFRQEILAIHIRTFNFRFNANGVLSRKHELAGNKHLNRFIDRNTVFARPLKQIDPKTDFKHLVFRRTLFINLHKHTHICLNSVRSINFN